MIAAGTMLADHIAGVFLDPNSAAAIVLHLIGRLSFPLILFLLVEGFCRTGSLKKYLLRLSIFAVISEIPYDLCFGGKMWEANNTLFTLVAALIALWVIRDVEIGAKAWVKLTFKVLLVGLLAFVTYLIRSDYAVIGVAGACAFYLLRFDRLKASTANAAILSVYSLYELPAFLTVPLIWKYNGERGKLSKYFFYIFYPVHLLVLWVIRGVVKQIAQYDNR